MASPQQDSEVPLRRSMRLALKKPKAVDNTNQQLKAEGPLKVRAPQRGQKRQQDQSDLHNGKHRRVAYKSTAQTHFKEGVTLRTTQSSNQKPPSDQSGSDSSTEGTRKWCTENSGSSHLLFPPCSTSSNHEDRSRKRQQAPPEESKLGPKKNKRPEKRQALKSVTEQTKPDSYNPIRYWACHQTWPPEFRQRGFGMEDQQQPGNKKKKKSQSSRTHHTTTIAQLAQHGISIRAYQQLKPASQDLCVSYLTSDPQAVKSSIFTPDEFRKVLDRVYCLNEARIQRDITPWVVPSAESLFFKGELNIDWIGEEIDARWIRCATMGSTMPKPDLTFGLLRKAFTEAEIAKLENYATPKTPFHFTPELCFPFLMCEVKSGDAGMNGADRQNAHSGAIAVNAIIQLYIQVFGKTALLRVQTLSGKALVFTASHNHEQVYLYAYYAIFNAQQLEKPNFYRQLIDSFNLSTLNGANRQKGYNFTVNVLKKFAVEHRERIKFAVARLPELQQRTGFNFADSEMNVDSDSSSSSSDDDDDDDDKKEVEEGKEEEQIKKLDRQVERTQKKIQKLMKRVQKRRSLQKADVTSSSSSSS